jgi:hypothetical protein
MLAQGARSDLLPSNAKTCNRFDLSAEVIEVGKVRLTFRSRIGQTDAAQCQPLAHYFFGGESREVAVEEGVAFEGEIVR